MKIRHVLRGRANPANADGLVYHTYHLSHAQRALGHDVEVYGIAAKLKEPQVIDRDGLTVRAFPVGRHPFAVHASVGQSLDHDRDVDIFHIQLPLDPAVYAVAKQLRSREIPYVVSAHALWSPMMLQRHAMRKSIYKSLFDDRLVKHALGVHATSAAEVDEIRRYAPNSRVFVVRNSVILEPIDDVPVRKDFWYETFPDVSPDARVFCFLGRLDPYQKGLDVLFQAWAHVTNQYPDVMLGLIGPYWRDNRQQLESELETLGIRDHVLFAGPLFDAAKYEALKAADCYIQVSRYEGSPYSVKEALTCRLPAIVTPGTNLGTAIEAYEAGYSVPLDPSAIADKVLAVAAMGPQRLSEMGANGRRLIEERHSLMPAAQRMVAAYEAVLTGSPVADDD